MLKRARYVVHTRHTSSSFVIGLLSIVADHFCIVSPSRNAIRVYTLSSRVHLLSEYVSIRCLTFARDKKKKKKKKKQQKKNKSIDNNDESKLTKLE